MSNNSFAEKVRKQEEEARKEGIAQGGSSFYKLQEGDNVFRVLAEPELIFEKFGTGICYTDCGYQGNGKFMTFVLDKRDGTVKLAKLPYSVGKMIGTYQDDEEYAFEGFPMPFNLKVNAKGAGTKEVEYTILASPNKTPVEASVMDELAKRGNVADIVESMKKKQKEAHIADGTWQREQDRKAKLAKELGDARSAEAPEPVIEYPEEEAGAIPF